MGSVGKITPSSNTPMGDGEVGADGSITMNYLHISNQGTANFGNQFGQNIEPTGEYMSFISPTQSSRVELPNYHYGTITFKHPLILEHKSTGENGWKKDLSAMFKGKTKKALSNAIKQAGYDGVVTWEEYKGKRNWVEVVNISGNKLS